MIKLAQECGADCVKFQKSYLPAKYNKKALLRTYSGPNSWGETYGAHKEFLEFTNEDFNELQKFSDECGILFSSSVMDDISLEFINSLNVPFIKIGSGDIHNLQLMKQAALLSKPLIISTGMSNLDEVVNVYNLIKKKHINFCLLHCVSSYPVPLSEVNLNVICTYKKMFPDINIGYSGHELGIDVSLGAVALGAKIIEKHFTLDKTLKGTDHKCSLTPCELRELIVKIRNFESNEINTCTIFQKKTVQEALGCFEKKFQNSEQLCFDKLGKSVVASVTIQAGEIITWDKICLKVAEPKGVSRYNIKNIIGKTTNKTIEKDESILIEDIIW